MTNLSESRRPEPVSVLIVDDHAVIRSGLRLLIETNTKFKVCGEAGSAAEAVEATKRAQPDVILLDIDLRGDDGLTYISSLLQSADRGRVLVLTGLNEPDLHARAIKAGAMGLVLKEKAANVLLKAIEKVNDGEVWFDRATMGAALSEISRGWEQENHHAEKIASLTERERDVVALIGEGLKNKHIAERLFISETTVRHHLTSIFDKLSVSDRLELVIYAYRNGLLKPKS